MATRTWSAAANGNWSSAANWDGGVSVPTGTDAIVFSATSVKNCAIDNLGSWSGGLVAIASTYTGVITQNSGVNLTSASFGVSGGTFTGHAAATFTSTGLLVQTGGIFNQGGALVCTTFTVHAGTFVGSSASMSTTTVVLDNSSGNITATSGTWTLAGSFTKTNSPTWNANGGTINITAACTFNAPSLTFNLINITTTNAAVTISASTTAPLGASPTTTVGTSTLTITGTITFSGTWSHTGSITVTATTGTITGSGANLLNMIEGTWTGNSGNTLGAINITMTITSATARTFAGAGLTYGNFYRAGSGTGQLTISDSNTFVDLKDNDGTAAHTLVFTNGTTQTVSTWTVSGSSGKLVTMTHSSGEHTAGNRYTIHTTGSVDLSSDYLSISDSVVDASPIWYAGANSTDGTNNVNWIFGVAGATRSIIPPTFHRWTRIPALRAARRGLFKPSVSSAVDSVTGTLAATLGDDALAAAGAESFSGTLASTLDGVTLAATGAETETGTLSSALDGVTEAATGAETFTGTFTVTLDGVTAVVTGSETIPGTLAVTLGDDTLAAAGVETITGTAAATLEEVTLVAAAYEVETGTFTVTLDGVTEVAAGSEVMSGALASTLGDVDFDAVGERTFRTKWVSAPSRWW